MLEKAKQHHQAMGQALASGDVGKAMHHAGHVMAALKQSPAQPTQDGGDMAAGSGDGNWIQGAVKQPGALHKELGVPQGQTIPAAKVAKAANSDNPLLARRARLAQTLKHLNKKGK